jgi:hypothetical protein
MPIRLEMLENSSVSNIRYYPCTQTDVAPLVCRLRTQPTSWPEHAINFWRQCRWVGDVFKHPVGDDQVAGVGIDRDILGVRHDQDLVGGAVVQDDGIWIDSDDGSILAAEVGELASVRTGILVEAATSGPKIQNGVAGTEQGLHAAIELDHEVLSAVAARGNLGVQTLHHIVVRHGSVIPTISPARYPVTLPSATN